MLTFRILLFHIGLSNRFTLPFPQFLFEKQWKLINQKVAVAILKRPGFNVDLAVKGEGLINALKITRYDLVFIS